MKVQFNDQTGLLSSAAIHKANTKLASSLSKFGNRVQSVTLSICDSNGPKGGIDKECKVLIKLKNMGEVTASANDESLSSAIAKTINRGERAVARRLQRNSLIDRDRRSEFGFAFYQ